MPARVTSDQGMNYNRLGTTTVVRPGLVGATLTPIGRSGMPVKKVLLEGGK
jgi:hypothetical protein